MALRQGVSLRRNDAGRRRAVCCALQCRKLVGLLLLSACAVLLASSCAFVSKVPEALQKPVLRGVVAATVLSAMPVPPALAEAQKVYQTTYKAAPREGFDFPIWFFPLFFVAGVAAIYIGFQSTVSGFGRIGPWNVIEEEDRLKAEQEERERIGKLKMYTDLDSRESKLK
mmetsp:Transcript_43577/g.79363  ORF Transcript_43577/g.79363 Transcript_43577/m.79363 type:complete len:170 (-) Transcript_43577:110-619(-)